MARPTGLLVGRIATAPGSAGAGSVVATHIQPSAPGRVRRTAWKRIQRSTPANDGPSEHRVAWLGSGASRMVNVPFAHRRFSVAASRFLPGRAPITGRACRRARGNDVRVTRFREFAIHELDEIATTFDLAFTEGGADPTGSVANELRAEYGKRGETMPMSYTGERLPPGHWGRDERWPSSRDRRGPFLRPRPPRTRPLRRESP
jgi:hypothetical protein